MDTNNLVVHARARFEHETARRVLREKYQSKMIFAHAGGMWRAGPDLQAVLLSCPGTEAVILDLYENPVKIVTKDLYALSQQRWQEQMTAWLIEYEQVQRQR